MSLSGFSHRSRSTASRSQNDPMLNKMLGIKSTTNSTNKQKSAASDEASKSASAYAAAASDSALAASVSAVQPSASASVTVSVAGHHLLDSDSFNAELCSAVASTVSESAKVRQSALEQVRSLIQAAAGESFLDSSLESVLKPVLKKFADSSERVREVAAEIILFAVNHHSQPAAILPLIIPIVKLRLGLNNTESVSSSCVDSSFLESSEEIRVSTLRLIDAAIQRSANSLEPFLSDLLQILIRFLNSSSPDALELSLSALRALSIEFRSQLRSVSPQLVSSIIPSLVHKLARVRIAALGAVRVLIPNGAAELIRDLAAFRESNVIDISGFFHGESRMNYFARLVADENPRVRACFHCCLHDWIENLYERSDYETLLFPYFLSGLGDENEEISLLTMNCLKRLGLVYEVEHEEEMKEIRDYGESAERESRRAILSEPILLFPPFQSRPTHAERAIARKFLDRLLFALCQEMNDWKAQVKRQTATLLRSLLLCAEEHISQFASKLLPAFLNSIKFSQVEPGKSFSHVSLRSSFYSLPDPLFDCLLLFGRYCPVETVSELLFPLINCQAKEFHSGIEKKSEAFLCIAIIVKSMPTEYFIGHLNEFASLFVEQIDSDSVWDIPSNCSILIAASLMDFLHSVLDRLAEERVKPELLQIDPSLSLAVRLFLLCSSSAVDYCHLLDVSTLPSFISERRKLSLETQKSIRVASNSLQSRISEIQLKFPDCNFNEQILVNKKLASIDIN